MKKIVFKGLILALWFIVIIITVKADYSVCDVYHWEDKPVPCPVTTKNKPDYTDCSVGRSYGECFSGTCYDCDYDSGNYCVGGPYHYGSYICNSWTKVGSVCCGDDSGEVYKTSTPTPPGDGTTACCSSVSDCVYQSTCYSTGTKRCYGTTAAMCNNGNIQQAKCQFGCVSGECKPGPVSNLLVNGQAAPDSIVIGQTITFSWSNPEPWQSYWRREGKIVKGTNVVSPSPSDVIISNTNIQGNSVSIDTNGAQAGTYTAGIRICSNLAGCSDWVTRQIELRALVPQVDRNTIIIEPTTVEIGRAMTIKWTDPQGYGQS